MKTKEYNLPVIQARIDKLNKKAIKIGTQPIQINIISEDFIDVASANNMTVKIKYLEITITGETPKINGWSFAATIQHEDLGNILKISPEFKETLPLEYRKAETKCDHCNTDRNRKDTYVLKSDAGEWKQVGRSCLKDFLGHASPEQIAMWAEMLCSIESDIFEELDENVGFGGRHAEYFALDDILLMTKRLVNLKGYIPKSKENIQEGVSYQTSTISDISDLFDNYGKNERRDYLLSILPITTDQDKDFIIKAKEAAQNLPDDIANDYLWNLKMLSAKEYINRKNFGLAASLISFYSREINKTENEKLNASSEYFGEEGKRSEYTLKVISKKEIETQYGITTMIQFLNDNNKAIWFASGIKDEYEIDQSYNVKATIKKHEDYKGRKQTQLTRVKII
jgi:hypothetical protein